MSVATGRQLRCMACNKRLADTENGITGGTAAIEIKCPRCGEPTRIVLKAQ